MNATAALLNPSTPPPLSIPGHRPAAHTLGRGGDTMTLAVRSAEALILAEPMASHSADSLARAVAVSGRSLYRGFERLRGYGPMEAVRRARLVCVHRDLAAGRPDTRVTEAAMRWGFFHLGRFSGLYLSHFGELPSETLRRSRRERTAKHGLERSC